MKPDMPNEIVLGTSTTVHKQFVHNSSKQKNKPPVHVLAVVLKNRIEKKEMTRKKTLHRGHSQNLFFLVGVILCFGS